jgi:hypothetical protein
MSYKTSGSCPRKAQARKDTIIEPYQELFQKSLPINKQYWTLAGPCYDVEGNMGTNSEFWQLTSSGLIFANQYHGIDNSEEIIENNRKCIKTGNFYHGDFITQLQIAAETGNFNPGIINCDFTKMVKTSAVDIGNIIYLLDKQDIHDTMIIVNFMVNNPYAGKLDKNTNINKMIEEFWNELKNNQRLNSSWTNDWNVYPECYLYGGTGKKSKTTMITFILFKH